MQQVFLVHVKSMITFATFNPEKIFFFLFYEGNFG